jgi:hypothetical protein
MEVTAGIKSPEVIGVTLLEGLPIKVRAILSGNLSF